MSTEKAALEAERADLQKALADARDEALSVERARKGADGERAELVRKAAQRTEYLQQQLDAHRSGKAAAEGALAREKTQTDSTTRELDALRRHELGRDFSSQLHGAAAAPHGRRWSDGEIRAAFERFDVNRSGKLDYSELRNCLHALGIDMTPPGAAQVLAQYDADRSGLMELDEFVRLSHSLGYRAA